MILTLGDSFTYGDELEHRENQAWPYLVAKQFKQEVNNLGFSGASNDSILRLAIEETCRKDYDLVIVGWAVQSRFETWIELEQKPRSVAYAPNHHANKVLPWLVDYHKFSYSWKWCCRRWVMQILLLQQYFKSINQPYIFLNVSGISNLEDVFYRESNLVWNKIDFSNFLGWPDYGMIQIAGDCPKGQKGQHPLELGHERIANEITKHIRNQCWFS
jgi:hypothetical protein